MWCILELQALWVERLPHKVVISAKSLQTTYKVVLIGEWIQSTPNPGMIFNLIVKKKFYIKILLVLNFIFCKMFNNEIEKNEIIIVDSMKRPVDVIYVLLPQILISATAVADASSCIRKTLLSNRFPQVGKFIKVY